jgi:hypothetical protein
LKASDDSPRGRARPRGDIIVHGGDDGRPNIIGSRSSELNGSLGQPGGRPCYLHDPSVHGRQVLRRFGHLRIAIDSSRLDNGRVRHRHLLLGICIVTREARSVPDCREKIYIVKRPDGKSLECVCSEGALATCFKPGP